MTEIATADRFLNANLVEPGLPPCVAGAVPIDLALVHGGTARVECRYELSGPPDAPSLVVAGGISAGSHVRATRSAPRPGWWQVQAPALQDYRVLAIDWIGSDGTLDQPIDAADQAAALLGLLDHLGFASAAAFIGASYGAMVGMQLAAAAPHRIGALLAISAAHLAHPFTSAQRALQRQAVELGERLGDAPAGVALARKIAMLSYRTPGEFAARFAPDVTVVDGRAVASAEPYLDHQGERHASRMSAVAYRRLSESIDLHRIDPARIAVPATFVAADDDGLMPSAAIEALAAAAPDGRFVSLPSRFGHDSFLKEVALVAALLSDFFASLETRP